MQVASLLVRFAMGYAAFGLAIGVVFILAGVDRVDQHARGAYAFRPLLLPGFMLIWPLAAARWLRARATRKGGG